MIRGGFLAELEDHVDRQRHANRATFYEQLSLILEETSSLSGSTYPRTNLRQVDSRNSLSYYCIIGI